MRTGPGSGSPRTAGVVVLAEFLPERHCPVKHRKRSERQWTGRTVVVAGRHDRGSRLHDGRAPYLSERRGVSSRNVLTSANRDVSAGQLSID
jgi:hypothetical protein